MNESIVQANCPSKSWCPTYKKQSFSFEFTWRDHCWTFIFLVFPRIFHDLFITARVVFNAVFIFRGVIIFFRQMVFYSSQLLSVFRKTITIKLKWLTDICLSSVTRIWQCSTPRHCCFLENSSLSDCLTMHSCPFSHRWTVDRGHSNWWQWF